MRAASEQIAGGTHRRGINIGWWEHAAAQQGRNLVGIDLVVVGLTAMNRLPIQGMPQDTGKLVLRAQVGEPLPGEDTFHRDTQAIPGGRDGLEKGFGRGLHITVPKHFSRVAQEADIHGASR